MPLYPFPHDGPVYIVNDNRYEVAHYRRSGFCYKRVRELDAQEWQDTIEEPIEVDYFWLVIASVERKAGA